MRSNDKTQTSRTRWTRRALLAAGLVLGVGGVAFAAGPVMHHGHPHTPEEAHAHIEKMLEHVLGKVDGTPAQREQIKAIVARTQPLMEGLHGEARDLKGEVHDVLTADKIDRAALEAARADLVDLVDRGTRVLFPAIADAAETLTPEQRRKISAALPHGPR
ncbi:Spy/CpxP family protein refolding chaperone [Nannocystis sp. ncelm1]|uniref:Spy/CpxP family protein refolding chaperone n=2 Tax=Nannocystis radixulma TaxID=2995305 RepID=A0ABT5B1J8_9BACT|nr:Spy/CpxP family protein refolding chaperone [Nannocystis radixulma]